MVQNSLEYSLTEDFANPIVPTIGETSVYQSSHNINVGTAGQLYLINFTLPNIEPNATIYVRIKSYTKAYPNTVDCASKRVYIAHGYLSSVTQYKNGNSCSGSTEDFSVSTDSGSNYGLQFHSALHSIPNVYNQQVYDGKIYLSAFYSSYRGMDNNNGYVDLVVQFSPTFTVDQSSLKLVNLSGTNHYTPAEIIPGENNTYRLRFKHGQGNVPTGNFQSPNRYLRFKATYNCTTPNEEAWIKVHAEATRLTPCQTTISSKCNTYTLEAHGCESGNCPEGGMAGGRVEAYRITLGLDQNVNGSIINTYPTPAATTINPENAETQNFSPNDQIEIAKSGRVIHTAQSPVSAWTKAEMKFTTHSGLRQVSNLATQNSTMDEIIVPNSGKVVLTRAGIDYVITGLPVMVDDSSEVKMVFTITDLHLKGLPTAITSFEHNDNLRASVVLQPTRLHESYATFDFQPTFALLTDTDIPYACGGQRYKSRMFYMPITFNLWGTNTTTDPKGKLNSTLKGCESKDMLNLPRFYVDVQVNSVLNAQDPAYPNEYRNLLCIMK